MRSEIRRGYAAAAAMTIAVALLALNLVGPIISTSTDFSIFNTGWNGTSNLAMTVYETGKFSPSFRVSATDTDLEVVKLGLDELELSPLDTALIIIGPTKDFTESEGAILGDFVREGGVLLLADDFGTGNSLLSSMGAGSRFSGKLVMDLSFEKRPEFSVCFDFEDDAVATNVTTVLLNYPSSIITAAGAEAIAYTSVASWLDQNGDHSYQPGEPWGPFPMLVRENLGLGTIFLLSDPSVLINGMRGHMDNAVFSDNLIAEISSERLEVYFDESHRLYFDPVTITMTIAGSFSTEAKMTLFLIALALLVWLSTNYLDTASIWIWRKIRNAIRAFLALILRRKIEEEAPVAPDIEKLTRQLTEKHPDWRPGLIRYSLREKMRHEQFLRKAEEE